ncbi:kelch repeat protein [Trichuris suis]|nr:kelch repeat protein [Trichuris suis]
MSSGEEISPTEISMEFISKDLLKRASEQLITMRQQGFLCDVTLLAHRQAADSTESELASTDEAAVGIRAHRVVLACSCPYFNAMFKSKMTETVKSSIFMHCVDADILEALVNFMYTGKITVTQKNVQDLLPAADLLQMTEVRDACCNFLERQMSVTNCLALKMFAEVHSCTELGNFAGAYIEKYFREVMETEDFCHISFEYLEELLSSDSLQVDKEDQVFDALIRWINYDVAGRSKYLYNLLENVRFSFVSPFCLIEDIVPNPLIRSSLSCSNHMVDALSALFLKINFPNDFDSYPTRPRICYLSGGSDARGLMVIGGQSPKAIREVDFLDFHTSSWTSLKELPMRRCRFGVANVDGDIYAVGGFNGGIRVRTVELFKFHTNTWLSAPLLQSRRSTLGVAELGGDCFVCALFLLPFGMK